MNDFNPENNEYLNKYFAKLDWCHEKNIPLRKTNKMKLWEKNPRFRNRENMWWAWPNFSKLSWSKGKGTGGAVVLSSKSFSNSNFQDLLLTCHTPNPNADNGIIWNQKSIQH